jgi:tetraacyldisaccharide 4'-kinase
LPAGPLREPVAAAAARCRAAVLIGPDATGALSRLDLPVLRTELVQDASIGALAGQRVLAFAGIAIPEKFFGPLRRAGAVVAAARAFPDHHPYAARDLEALLRQAEALNARLVTTPKDAVRLPPAFHARVTVIGVGLAWERADEVESLLDAALTAPGLPWRESGG